MSTGAVAALIIAERDRDLPGLVIPRAEVHLSVRLGPATQGGVDVHVLGALEAVRRKVFRSGQRMVLARLHLGAVEAALGTPASALSGRIVPLDELWGGAVTRRLVECCAGARDMAHAAEILQGAIAERVERARGQRPSAELALAAADRLASAQVSSVASELGVSERHLRRVFRETIGVSPKTFAKLTRFRRALRAAREHADESWTQIAAAAGYYDQAHLIAEFRAISGVTPRALLGELRVAQAIG